MRDRKGQTIFVFALAMFVAYLCKAQPPQAKIANKQLHVILYLPDAKNGFYKGTRFDWSGVIADLEFSGHHLYKPWFAYADSETRDVAYKEDQVVAGTNSAITGPVEEFQTPIGYESAKPGEIFLKIGVGLLRKIDDKPYSFTTRFELVDGGKWTIRKTATSIIFRQVLGTKDNTYAYVYTKTIRLAVQSNQLVIEHRLRNTGTSPLSTRLYDHNFLTIDDIQVGSSYSISVPYRIVSTRLPDSKFVKIDGSTATYIADLQGQDKISFGLQGFSADPKDYRFSILNRTANLQITISGDRPLANASVWSIRSVLAVEPFLDIQADPGKAALWSYRYTYENLSTTSDPR